MVIMINRCLAIAILARDCANNLRDNIERIEVLRKKFRSSFVVVVENDSIDSTKDILNDWSLTSSHVYVLSENLKLDVIPNDLPLGINPSTSCKRIGRMVYCRNKYLTFIKEKKLQYDYLLVVDIDVEYFSVNGIIDGIINAPLNWGGIFANGYLQYGFIRKYRDSYAYFPYGMNKNDYSNSRYHLVKFSRELTFKMLFNKYVKVVSAFGGIAVYKRKAIEKIEYVLERDLNSDEFEALCEHIPFNSKIINRGYCNYISSNMYVRYKKTSIKTLASIILPTKLFLLIYDFFKK